MNLGPVFVVACVWEKEKGTGVVVMEAPIYSYQGSGPLNLPENFLYLEEHLWQFGGNSLFLEFLRGHVFWAGIRWLSLYIF